MDVSIISQDDVLRTSCVALQLQHKETDGTLYAQIPAEVSLLAGDCLGFADVRGRYRIFEISTRELREPDGVWEIDAVDKAICELMDDPVTDIRARGTSIVNYLTRLLQATRYSIGTVAVNPTGTTSGYYESVWSAMAKAMTAYDVRLVPYYTLTNGVVSGRYVDILSTAAADHGRIFELGDDLTGLSVKYDDSQIKTALFGRGQGVQIDAGDGSDPAYGRRLTFSDVVWSTSAGDPVDKPAGQEWVGDPDALTAYGRGGRHRYGYVTFDQETDAEELLQKTWDKLQEIKDPIISITGTVRDTARLMGHAHEAVELGDSVLVRADRMINGVRRRIDIRARIVDIVRDYVQPEETKLTIGNASLTAGAIVRQMSSTLDNYESRSAVWDRANAFDLQGAMDIVNNTILSTTGSWHTDPVTGAIVFESTDGTKAMRLTGAGWQIASGKDQSGAWVWTTAATGAGIVANAITAGTLNAGLVTIGGTGTTLDGTSLEIKHPTISANAKTVIDENGLQMLNGQTLLGGIILLNNAYTSVIQTLYNAQYPQLKVDLGEFAGGAADIVYGLKVSHNGIEVLKLGAGFIEGSLMDAEIIGERSIIMLSWNGKVTIGAGNTSITLDNDGDIDFTGFKSDGTRYHFTGTDIYRLID